ncbi:pilus assembly protein PilO [Yersinia rohdei]|uniref:pilus assembly protein PilO n=1 Tax=Yersinia rohdei TaxID=29485 RepID=UPI0028F40757|nr:pilus assembly protein PilO [Yersinia rohdei]
MMNKQLQRWIDRPGWQIALYQLGGLGLLGAIVYSLVLYPRWQPQQLAVDEIIQLQQQVEYQKLALAQLPSHSSLQQKLSALTATNTSWPPVSMANLVGQWIAPYGGLVIGWQQQLEPEIVALTHSVSHQLWQVSLRVNFYGLLHLLHQLSSISSPTQLQLIEIKRDSRELIVKLNLREYLTEGSE